jgi:hypothetical protein
MIEREGDLFGDVDWDPEVHGPPWVVIPTNGSLKANKTAVMGAGVAAEATRRASWAPCALGSKLMEGGNHVHILGSFLVGTSALSARVMVSFPTKNDWRKSSLLWLIDRSANELWLAVHRYDKPKPAVVLLPRVGTGLGRLGWCAVKPALERHLAEDRFVVVSL